MVYKCVDATELRLILMWRKRGMSLGEIAGLLGRCKATVSRQVKKSRQKNGTKVGRPASLTDEDLAMKSWRIMCIADFSLTRACPLHPESHCCLTFGGVLVQEKILQPLTRTCPLHPEFQCCNVLSLATPAPGPQGGPRKKKSHDMPIIAGMRCSKQH